MQFQYVLLILRSTFEATDKGARTNAIPLDLLGSLGYPCVNEGQQEYKVSFIVLFLPGRLLDILRFGCDVVNILFLFDEFSDCGEENSVEHLRNVVMDALRNPSSPRPANELAIGEIVRQ